MVLCFFVILMCIDDNSIIVVFIFPTLTEAYF